MNVSDLCNGERRRKRILTDARKEQNRVAQRAYRKRRNENSRKTPKTTSRIQNGLRPIRPYTGRESSPPEAIGSRPNGQESITNIDNNDSIEQADNIQPLEEFDWMQAPSFVQVEDLEPGYAPSFPFAPYSDANIPPVLDSVSIQGTGLILCLDENQFNDAPLCQTNWPVGPELGGGPQNPNAALQLVTSLRTTEINSESQYGQPEDSSIWSLDLLPYSKVALIRPGNQSDTSETSDSQSNRKENSRVSRPRIDDQTQNTTTPPSLPSPYDNNLWLPQPILTTAGLHNALSLNIALTSILTSRLLSPFYRPSTRLSDDPIMLLSQASKQSFPPHLKPTLPQILFPHHAWIDLVPFPILRERTITLAATSPKMFDIKELKLDIMYDGLRYKSHVGDGHIDSNAEPWDGRNWVVEPWFLKKWRMLMVGTEGTFWK